MRGIKTSQKDIKVALHRGSQKRLRMFVCKLKIEEISGVLTCFKEYKKQTRMRKIPQYFNYTQKPCPKIVYCLNCSVALE